MNERVRMCVYTLDSMFECFVVYLACIVCSLRCQRYYLINSIHLTPALHYYFINDDISPPLPRNPRLPNHLLPIHNIIHEMLRRRNTRMLTMQHDFLSHMKHIIHFLPPTL